MPSLFRFTPEIKTKLQTKYKVKSSNQIIYKLEEILKNASNGSKLENIFLGDLLISLHHPDMMKNEKSGFPQIVISHDYLLTEHKSKGNLAKNMWQLVHI